VIAGVLNKRQREIGVEKSRASSERSSEKHNQTVTMNLSRPLETKKKHGKNAGNLREIYMQYGKVQDIQRYCFLCTTAVMIDRQRTGQDPRIECSVLCCYTAC